MKKITLGIFALVSVAIVSCAKDYTCECKVTHNEQASIPIVGTIDNTHEETNSFTMKGKEEEMKSACEKSGFTTSYEDQVGIKHKITSNCQLK